MNSLKSELLRSEYLKSINSPWWTKYNFNDVYTPEEQTFLSKFDDDTFNQLVLDNCELEVLNNFKATIKQALGWLKDKGHY